jgi:ribosomal protein L35AE/L33A
MFARDRVANVNGVVLYRPAIHHDVFSGTISRHHGDHSFVRVLTFSNNPNPDP